ncbi:hypothetical protein [Streptomyces sp. NRRL B-24572]|uniref:hypothetical protein n=1 Tax=Streptomyces sp. NRRL B-24572 TaxID=1962156 RepID=UPI000A39418F|nr:hypothetical protein [Streptomyces sp. NRRL B-24572]
MPNSSSIPVLLGDGHAELRSEGEALLLRRPHEEVRIPLAAIARVRAEGRDVTVELTAPVGVEAASYRIEDVSRAAATAFADAVNGTLPDRTPGEEAVDGSALVVVSALGTPDTEREDDEEEPDEKAGAALTRVPLGFAVLLVVLSVSVGVAGKEFDRAVAVLMLGSVVGAFGFFSWLALWSAWDDWYLPRHGITVEANPVLIQGRGTYAYTDTTGRVRPVAAPDKARGETIRVAYHPRKPQMAVAHKGIGSAVKTLIGAASLLAVTALAGWGTAALALPAFGG